MAELNLTFEEGITFDDLTAALQRVVAAAGCPGCGLNGWDLRFRVDPEERFRQAIAELDFVKTISVNPAVESFANGAVRPALVQ